MDNNKKQSGGGCSLTSIFIAIIVIAITIVAGGYIASSFGKGFAEGGGDIRFKSDNISAESSGDHGVTVAAGRGSEVEVSTQQDEATSGLGLLLLIFVAILVTVTMTISRLSNALSRYGG